MSRAKSRLRSFRLKTMIGDYLDKPETEASKEELQARMRLCQDNLTRRQLNTTAGYCWSTGPENKNVKAQM